MYPCSRCNGQMLFDLEEVLVCMQCGRQAYPSRKQRTMLELESERDKLFREHGTDYLGGDIMH